MIEARYSGDSVQSVMGPRMKKSRNVPGVLALPTVLVLGLLLVIPTIEAAVEELLYHRSTVHSTILTEHGHGPTYEGDKIPENGHGPTYEGDNITENGHGPTYEGDNITENGHGPTYEGDKVTENGHGPTYEGDNITVNGHGPTYEGDKVTENGHGPTYKGDNITENGHGPTYEGDKITKFAYFMDKFNREYNNSEHSKRNIIFNGNVKVITEHNKLWKNGNSSYFLRINDFTDLTAKEFGDRYLGGGHFQSPLKAAPTPCEEPKPDSAPRSYGAPTNSHNSAHTSYGAPTNSLNSAPKGYGAPTNSHNSAPIGYGAPTNSHNSAPNGYGAPTNSHNSAPNGYGAPTYSLNSAPIGYGAPTNSLNSAPISYGALTHRINSAPISYGAPTNNLCYSHTSAPIGYGVPRYRCKRQANDVAPITYIDWIGQGVRREVGDQQECNSCAAHCAITLLEHCMWKLNGNLPEPLSVQQILACTHGKKLGSFPLIHDNSYCEYGSPDIHLDYLRQLWVDSKGTKNIQLEKDTRGIGNTCPAGDSDPTKVNVRVTGAKYELFTTETDMIEALQAGPVETRISFRVGLKFTNGWQSYGGGVFYEPNECSDYATETVPDYCQKNGQPGTYDCVLFGCTEAMPKHCSRFLRPLRPGEGRHSIVVVGAGRDERNDHYWTIKNSWGKRWGENGFLRMSRGLGHCGIGSSYNQVECDVI